MASKEGERSKSWKVALIIFTIISALIGIVLTTAVHYKLLTDNQPGYPFGKFLVRFFWLDILIGLGIGFILFIIILIGIFFYVPSKEESTSTQ